MPIIEPTPVASLLDPPNPSQTESEFDEAAYNWSADLIRWNEDVNGLAGNVYNNATEAKAAADTATTKAAEVAANANAVAAQAAEVAANTGTVATHTATATDKANEAAASADRARGEANESAASADRAHDEAMACVALVESIAGGPVASVNGKTGPVITLDPADVGSVPVTRKINGQELTSDLTIAAGIDSVATTPSATSMALTASSAGYQSIAMTAMGKHVALPDATTMIVGGPRFILKNDGGYPFGIRDSAGTLVIAVAPGGTAYVTLKDNGTAAGSWSVIGDSLEPGLITIDNTFSGTYSATVLKPFVALDNSKSIHFLVDAATGNALYAVAVDNAAGTVGTPTLVDGATAAPRAVFKVSSTSCILFYSNRAVVITLSGSTTLSVGTYAVSGDSAMFSAEDFSGAPRIAQLTSTLYLASYTSGTNTSVVAVSVSGTTVAIGSAANIITANSVAGSTTTYALTATTGLVTYGEGAVAPYSQKAVVVSVDGTTCTVNTPATISLSNAANSFPNASCLLSPTKLLAAEGDNVSNAYRMYAVTVSGTSLSVGAVLSVETGFTAVGAQTSYTDFMATRYNPHLHPLDTSRVLLWYRDGSGISRTVVLTESGGTITAGAIKYGAVSVAATNAAGGGAILPQGVSEFVAIRTRVASSAGYSMFIVPASITGNSIAVGKAAVLPAATLGDPAQQLCGRFASGKYLLQGFNNGNIGTLEATVFESNGDSIRVVGGIKLPPINPLAAVGPMAVVSSSRVVLLGSQTNTSTGGQGGLRLLNVEIAQ